MPKFKSTDSFIELDDGKYTVVLHEDYTFEALRYGEPWRDLTGDGMIFSMFLEIRLLRSKLEDLRNEIS